MYYIAGLGNPGAEYEKSRHNTGRMAIFRLLKDLDFPEMEFSKKANALVSEGKIGKEKTILILPETFMNKSGNALSYFIKSKKAAENLIVIYDDIDLPLGVIKIAWNKGSGGHKGLESVVRAVKTREFTRIRIGVSPITSKGKIKKPAGDDKVVDFILSKFKPAEETILKKIIKRASQAAQAIVEEGKEKAMNLHNS